MGVTTVGGGHHRRAPTCPDGAPLPCAARPPRREWAAKEGWLPSAAAPCRFVFDGEALPVGETPEGLDLEGGEIIEVHL